MAIKKRILATHLQKTDTTENWGKATNFIPLKGEIIYYQDPGKPIRYKVGDGIIQSNGTITGTKVNDLPFANEVYTNIVANGIVYDDIVWETILNSDDTFEYKIEVNGIGYYLGVEGEEPFEEIHYELENPDGDNSVSGSGDYYSVWSDPAGEYFYLSITLPEKYRNEEYYDKKLYLANSYRTATAENYSSELTTAIIAGDGIILTNDNGETTIAADLLQTLENTAVENPVDQAPSAFAVADALTKKSEGVNANYNFTSPGWKRVLNIIRATNGNLNLGIAKTTNGKVTQGLGIDFAGYVKFPNEDFRKGKPVIYQRYNNLFGLDPAEYPEKRAQITKVRIGYPTSDYGTNPVNCYVDIYIDFEPRAGQEDYVAFNMSYSGKAASHNTTAIIEETPATDTGMYGETLQYYEFEPKVGPDIYTEGEIEASKFIGNVEADNISAKELFSIGEETRNFNVTGNFADVKVTSNHTDNTIQAYKRYNYLYNVLKTGDTVKNGVTITVQDSGAMTLNGTCTKDTTHPLFNGYSSTNPIIYLPAGTYKTHGIRFLMWGIDEDKTNYETILPMNSARNQFLDYTFTITEPKYIGHASIYLKNKVSWNNVSIVPYLYRIDDTEEVAFNYNTSTDTITITNDNVNIKITDRGDLYGTSIKGEKALGLDNTTVLENGKVANNNYVTLVAENTSTFKAEAKTKLVTIGLNADGSIKAPDSLKQAFKDWLGISEAAIATMVDEELNTIAEEGTW